MVGIPATPHLPGYRDLVPLGRGGFSEVHRAYQERFDRWVAVKVLSFALTDEGVQRRFLRECQLAGRVSAHPHVATIYDAGIAPDGRPYLAMELYDGGSAADRLEARGPFDVAEALRIAVALAGALESAHRAGVVHRDVKPGNVLLTGYGHPALTDFGLSVLAERQEVSVGADALSPYHAPPEVLDHASPTPASDVYSLASTTYTMLAGKAPHQVGGDDTLAALLARILNADAPALGRPDVPGSLGAALQHGLARDPGERTPSALAFAQEVQRAQADMGIEPTQPVVLGPPPGAEAPPPGAPGVPVPIVVGPPPGAGAQLSPGGPGTPGSGAELAPPGPPPGAPGWSTTLPAAESTMQRPGLPEAGVRVGGPGAVPPAPVIGSEQPAGAVPPVGDETVHRDRVVRPRPAQADDQAKRSRRVPLIVGGLVLAVAAAGAVALVATRDGGEETADPTTTTESTEEPTTTEQPPAGEGTDSTGTTASTAPTPEDLDIAGVTAPDTALDWVDGCENPVGFGADNMADGEDETAWRMEGDASGQSLTVSLGGEHRVLSVGLLPGYASTDPCDGTDNFADNRRPTSVTWVFGDGTEATQRLSDVPEMQTMSVDATTSTITLRIDGVTAEPETDYTAISELAVQGIDEGG